VLAHELEGDAGSSSSSRHSRHSRHSLLPAVHAAGPSTSLATYLLPELATQAACLGELGLHVLFWLRGVSNLLSTAEEDQDSDLELPQPHNGIAFARVFRPSPQMVSSLKLLAHLFQITRQH
jgi:hypothetical protein